jgi:phosphatidylethanolamine-binding protein (PEBP) family uncharacterized protein
MKNSNPHIYHFEKRKSIMANPKKASILVLLSIISIFNLCFCTDKHKDAMVMGVDFEWQPIDYGSNDNPKILLTNVPEGTKRFFVSLVDLNITTYDHGGGYVDSNGSGIISRGSIKGNYNGPAPWLPNMIHDYEITVKAYDENDRVIGIGKKARKFLYGPK